MKKIAIVIALLACLSFCVPAIAGGDAVIYGIVTKVVSPFGPALVETYDGMSIRAQLPKNADLSAFYLGCEVSCRADVDGKMYIIDLPTPFEKLSVCTWVAQVRRFSQDSNRALVSSPTGDVMVFLSNDMLGTPNVREGSLVRLSCAKPVWGVHLVALSFELVSH